MSEQMSEEKKCYLESIRGPLNREPAFGFDERIQELAEKLQSKPMHLPPMLESLPKENAEFFTKTEAKAMEQDPDVLRALASWHSCQETMADGMGMHEPATYHENRRKELLTLAEKIEQSYN